MIFEYDDAAAAALAARDKRLAAAMARIGRIEREVNPDLFAALIESILSQQVSNKAAATVIGRLVAAVGEFTPANLDAATAAEIQACGTSHRKAGYVKAATTAVVTGALDLARLWELPDDDVIAELVKLPGVGVWTAEMLLIFSMQRPNVMSYGDLAIRRGICRLYGHKELPRERFERYRRRYSPHCSIASLYLWEISA